MKEATGELNMTVVTVVAIAAIGAFFYAFVWPGIQTSIKINTCEAVCGEDGVNRSQPQDSAGNCICTANTTH